MEELPTLKESCKWRECSAIFTVKESLLAHVTKMHIENGETCEWDSCFTNTTSLIDHLTTIHLKIETNTANICRWKSCQDDFPNVIQLTQHVSKDHVGFKKPSYNCYWINCCIGEFKQRPKIMKHLQSHIGYKPYSCTNCPKKFADKYQIEVHNRSHTGERPFSCGGCGKRFRNNHSLSVHNRTHTGIFTLNL